MTDTIMRYRYMDGVNHRSFSKDEMAAIQQYADLLKDTLVCNAGN